MRKLALKKLKPSDLSFFKSYLKLHPQAKQKGFNLDTRVLEGRFFPALKALLEPLPKKAVHVDLTLLGPGLARAHSLARKIKIDEKNIRLNGECVDGPVEDSGRYDLMAPSDFALMEFTGAATPTAVKVVLVAAANAEDSSLHAALVALMPKPSDSMQVLAEEQLAALINQTDLAEDHPIREWLDAVLLEDVGSDDADAVQAINARRPGRGLTHAELKASKESAERIGRLGEELLDQHFRGGCVEVISYEWVASINAISPFDFLLTIGGGVDRHVDAKSTSGYFSNPIYLSIGEIRHAVGSGVPYDIYRLYEVKETSALLRVALDVAPRLVDVLPVLDALPIGVKVDKLSFDPEFFAFEHGVVTILSIPDADVDEVPGVGAVNQVSTA